MTDFVRGTCEEMCPEYEVKLRTRERLLNFFETKSGQKNVPGKLVKSFSRSAAGVKTPRRADLRSERCLHRTTEYLLKEIVLDKRKPFNCVYDFVFDRLRAVRQEIVMQNFDSMATVKLLEPTIMFLAYSRYRLCEEPIDNFDPKICDQHLQECLKRVLCCYDELNSSNTELNLKCKDNQIFIESLYQLFNLGSPVALNRSLRLSQEVRNDHLFMSVQSISLNCFRGNYYKALWEIKNLPHLLCAMATVKLPTIRQQLFKIFSHGYNNKQLLVPMTWLQNVLIYSSIGDLTTDCKYYNLELVSDKNAVRFSKADFDFQKPPQKSIREQFVEEKLRSIYLPEVLLLKKY